jgi:hypothetical protein
MFLPLEANGVIFGVRSRAAGCCSYRQKKMNKKKQINNNRKNTSGMSDGFMTQNSNTRRYSPGVRRLDESPVVWTLKWWSLEKVGATTASLLST